MATEIKIPRETLVTIISRLPSEGLSEIRRQIDNQLSSRTNMEISPRIAAVEDQEFWNSELGRMICEEADDSLSHEKRRQSLSSIRGSLSDDVSAERDER